MNVTNPYSPRYLAALAVAAGMILVAGWWFRPRDVPQSPPPVPSESELAELGRRAERRSLESTTAYFAELAASVRPSLAFIPPLGTSGVVWDDSHVVTGPLGDRATVTLRSASGEQSVDVRSSRRLPLALLGASVEPPARVVRRAASAPQSGDWVIAVWQTDDAPAFAPANVRQITGTACGTAQVKEVTASIPLTRAMAGGGLFTLDRELLAVILPCGDHMKAVESSSIDAMLSAVTTIEERLLALYGILFTSLSPAERQYFPDSEGLFVREVWMGTRGEEIGFRPGDIVVGLNGRAVGSVEELRPLTTPPGAAFEIRVHRGRNTRTLRFDPGAPATLESSGTDADVGLVLESPAAGLRLQEVPPRSRAARAGVKAGDILRRVDDVEPRTRAQADRAVASAASKPLLLEVERGQRRLAIVVPGDGPR